MAESFAVNGSPTLRQHGETQNTLLTRLSKSKEVKFFLGTTGVYASYVYYGYMQERLFKHDYSNGAGVKFTYSFSIILMQAIFSSIIAFLVNRLIRNSKPRISYKISIKMGGMFFLGMIASNTALQYVSYPIQALVKSCKILSVLLVGLLVGGQRYAAVQYICAILITLGIFIFNLTDGKTGGTTTYTGLILCLFSLFCDGMLAEYQTECKAAHKPSGFEMKENTSIACAFMALVWGLGSGQLYGFIRYCEDFPSVIPDVITISMLGSTGLLFMYYIVEQFSPLVLSIITTTRKFFNVLFSIFWFAHPLNGYQWLSVCLVFTGVIIDTAWGYMTGGKHKKHHHHHHKVEDDKHPSVEFTQLPKKS